MLQIEGSMDSSLGAWRGDILLKICDRSASVNRDDRSSRSPRSGIPAHDLEESQSKLAAYKRVAQRLRHFVGIHHLGGL
jgi:hypothetical protein